VRVVGDALRRDDLTAEASPRAQAEDAAGVPD
jgi:hypothetical protein